MARGRLRYSCVKGQNGGEDARLTEKWCLRVCSWPVHVSR